MLPNKILYIQQNLNIPIIFNLFRKKSLDNNKSTLLGVFVTANSYSTF